MEKKKVVLAYSGGLDTSYCVQYLSQERGLEVHTVIVDTGGFDKNELDQVEKSALYLGASSHHCLNEAQNYYQNCIRYLIYGNILKNNSYPLSVSSERVFQALAIAKFAQETKADYVAHGSTGAGNDQVRFDVVFRIMMPNVPILSPIRDQQLSREQEIQYLKDAGVNQDWEKAIYSVNKGLWGTTVGGKETLTSDQYLPEEAFPHQLVKNESEELRLQFEQGELVGINEEKFEDPIKAIQTIEGLAAPYAIGRDIHVGDTVIGIKGRVGFQAAAPLILIKAHHALEKHTLTKWQIQLKEQLASWYGTLLHEGQFLEPALRDIEHFFTSTQKQVGGKVRIYLAPYRFHILGVESDHDLMSSQFGSYGEANKAWDGEDVKGFSKIMANQTMIYKMVNKEL
ncbi:MAG: argininosuccinate synthase [Bacteroidetes bacterium]|nr:argininosuccinate synthase [Bacteroidota bacterium]